MANAQQLENEIETLVESLKDLQEAKQKFKESLLAIEVQRQLPNDKQILVPLTTSMYVPGYITNTKEFLVDIGTQYLIEKDDKGAIEYFERKMKFIDKQVAKFSELLQTRLQYREKRVAMTQKKLDQAKQDILQSLDSAASPSQAADASTSKPIKSE